MNKIVKNILKYLSDFVVDRIDLSELKPETLAQEWLSHSATINNSIKTVHENSIDFTNIEENDIIALKLLEVERLDDRSTIEVDIIVSSDIGEGELSLLLCEGESITENPKMTITNTEAIVKDKLQTVTFLIPGNLNNKAKGLNRIGSVGLKFIPAITKVTIAKITAYNPEYLYTIEEILSFYDSGKNYVLSGLERTNLPDKKRIQDSVYQASAGYIWLDRYPKHKKRYGTDLFKWSDQGIAEFLNGGSIKGTDNKRLQKHGGFKWIKE